MTDVLIAHTDRELFDWLLGVINPKNGAGSFLTHLAYAALCADPENYPVLRPVLVAMALKYPNYAHLERARAARVTAALLKE